MQFSDLTSEGLAKLEAKLLADVEVVRRMRELLEEHRAVWDGRGGAEPGGMPKPGAVVAARTVTPAIVEAKPRKSLEDLAEEWLAGLEDGTFLTDQLRWAIRKRGTNPSENDIKTLMNRLQRTGKVTVQEKRKGRGGSLFRRLTPGIRPENPGTTEAPAVADAAEDTSGTPLS